LASLSLIKAEYSDCSCQLIWMMNLLKEVSFDVLTSYLYGDNLGLLFQSFNSIQVNYYKYKYIDICYHYVRDLIEDEQIILIGKRILLIS